MTHNTSKEKRSNPVLKRATILAAQGKSDQALQLVQTHLGKFPRDIEALNLAGSFAAQLESWAQAEKFFLEVLARNKSNTYSLYNLAKVYKLSGQLNESISILMNLLVVEPGNVSALNEIGFLFTKTGDIESALHAFQKSIQIDPMFELAYRNLYATLIMSGRYEEATQTVKAALQKITSDYRYTLKVDLIVCLWRSRDFEGGRLAAINIIDELTQLNAPRYLDLLARAVSHYGIIFMELNEIELAEEQFKKAISLDSKYIEPYINLAKVHLFREDLLQSIQYFDAALAIDPGNGELHMQLGSLLRDAGRPQLALPHHQSAVAQSPGNPELRYYLGTTQLALGQLAQGFDNLEFRWARREGGHKSGLDIPEWSGSPESGRSIFVYKEQGLGDEVLFATCMPDLIGRFEHIVCLCHPKLKTLFARSFPQVEFCDSERALTADDLGNPDFQIPIGSLPRIFRRSLDYFPSAEQVLIPDADKVALFREHLARKDGKLIVGIAWRSSLQNVDRRSIYPVLDYWSPLLQLPGIVWVNLQYGDVKNEIKNAEQEFGVAILDFADVDHFTDLDTSAALMKACDLVIGPATSTTQISAAIGVPTIRLSSGYDYFCLGTDYYPWFPSLNEISRPFGETWTAPIQQTANIVQILAAEHAHVAGSYENTQ